MRSFSIRTFVRLASTASVKNNSAPSFTMNGVSEKETGLHKIAVTPNNPFALFTSWFKEQQTENIGTNTLCLSTSTMLGKVSARNVVLRRLDEDGFVIMTDNRSKKAHETEENPYAAMTFLWVTESNGSVKARQVRAEGIMKELPVEDCQQIYDQEPLFCKIRAYVCHQGQKVDWENLKEQHDKLLKEYISGNHKLEKPDHVRAYKLHPTMLEFYETEGAKIADRLLYLVENDCWKVTRIAA